MSTSFICKIFGCSSNPRIYSAKINAQAGFDSPEPIPGLPGWTVWKQQQTEIYKIQHNLGLTSPETQLHIVATAMEINTILILQNITSNDFVISIWTPNNQAPKQSDFMFMAAHYR